MQVLFMLLLLVYNAPSFARDEPDSAATVIIHTELGDIRAVLYMKHAPVTCANFMKYVGLFGKEGGTFYRTVTPENQPDNKIKIEVIQGGFNPDQIDTAGIRPVLLERTSKTGLSHKDGTLSMARNSTDSGSTEFFICIGDQPELDYGGMRNPDGQGFAAFGRVVSGMEIVRLIQHSPANGQTLTPPVLIHSIDVIEE